MFDSPTRDVCSARRIATNTPLQALVTLNDPVYVECARALSKRAISATEGRNSSEVIAWMYRAVTQREPSEWDQSDLESLYVDLRIETDGSTEDPDLEAGAMSIVANTILNLDRALTK